MHRKRSQEALRFSMVTRNPLHDQRGRGEYEVVSRSDRPFQEKLVITLWSGVVETCPW